MAYQLAPAQKRRARDLGLIPGIGDLLAVAKDAVSFGPPNEWPRAFLGPEQAWLGPPGKFSEFHMRDLSDPGRLARYLVDVVVPSVPALPPAVRQLLPPLISGVIEHPTTVFEYPGRYAEEPGIEGEKWFFINGILTNKDFAELNAQCITELFHRPLTVIQNSTDGTLLDLWECAVGKEWTRLNTESATVAFPYIYHALRDPGKQRVVVVAHSQGTIILASVWHGLKYLARRHNRALRSDLDSRDMPLDMLASIVQAQLQLDLRDFQDLTEQEVAKLEMYCFANCATRMRHMRQPPGCPPIPWMESFGNEFDLVARLGMLAPHPEEHHIHLDGPMYWRPGAWGHLLNLHYLNPIAEQQQVGAQPGGATGDASPFVLKNGEEYPAAAQPRLYAYINGGTAPDRFAAPAVAAIEVSEAPAEGSLP